MQARQLSPVAGYIEYVLVLHPDVPEQEPVRDVMGTFRLSPHYLELVRNTVIRGTRYGVIMLQVQVHEAGHLLVARQLCFTVRDAWASARDGSGEVEAEILYSPDTASETELQVRDFATGGIAAEIAYYGNTTLR